MSPKQKPPDIRTRRAKLSTLDSQARTVEATLATDDWIDGPYGRERLVMTPEAVDMSAADPMPLHDTHGPSLPGTVGTRIGVVEKVRLVGGGRLNGRLRLSKNPEGEASLTDMADGIVTHVSIGYRVIDAKPTKRGLLITKWAPHEVSLPSVVADRQAIIQRGNHMNDDLTPDPSVEDSDGYKAGQRAEQQRVAEIYTAFEPFPRMDALRQRALAESWTIGTTRQALLAELGRDVSPSPRGPDIVAGDTDMEKFTRAASDALCVRAGIVQDPKRAYGAMPVEILTPEAAMRVRRENEYVGHSLRELAREYLRRAGDTLRGDPSSIIGRALTRQGIIGHSTSDFANLLVDAANKSMQIGYEEAPETYDMWTRPGTLPDFKTGHRPKLSTFSDLDEVPESGELKYGTFSDFKETIALVAYAKLFSISRKAVINDDLGAFTDSPRAMARAARRKVGNQVYGVLSTNGNMSDGVALFATGHSNYIAGGSGAAPSVTTLNAAYTSMATQTDPASNTLGNITPQYIIAPHALRGTIDALLASSLNPAEGSSVAFQEANVWRGRLTPVYDARIDADDAAKWYLAASPNAAETIEVAYLNGVQTPRLEQQDGFTVDGVIMKVAHDVGVAPLDWRYMYHNDGN